MPNGPKATATSAAPAHPSPRIAGAAHTWACDSTATAEALAAELASLGREVRIASALCGAPVHACDLRSLARAARSDGAILVADNTLSTLVLCSPCQLGAHVCVECAVWATCDAPDAFGAADALGSATGPYPAAPVLVSVSRDAERGVPGVTALVDAWAKNRPASADQVAHIETSLSCLKARTHASCDAAQVVASFLACHPLVSRVAYPGLSSDPSQPIAANVLHGGFGRVVDFLPVATANPSGAILDAWAAEKDRLGAIDNGVLGFATVGTTNLHMLECASGPWLRLAVDAVVSSGDSGPTLCMLLERALKVAR